MDLTLLENYTAQKGALPPRILSVLYAVCRSGRADADDCRSELLAKTRLRLRTVYEYKLSDTL